MADTNTRSGSSAWDGSAHHGATGAGNVDNDGTPVDGDGTPVNNDGTPVDDARVDAAAAGAAAPESSTNESAEADTAQAGNAGADSAGAENAGAGTAGAGTAGTDTAGVETDATGTASDGAAPGPAQVRTPPVTETDPLLVHVGESIEEAKEAAREVFGEHGSGSEDEVDPNLGTSAPVP